MSTYPIFRTKHKNRSGLPNGRQEKSQSLYQVYVSQLAEFPHTLGEARKTFCQPEVWPDQCEYVSYRIRLLQKTAAGITGLNDTAPRQEGRSSGNRYALLVSAHYLSEQADRLATEIQEYREMTDRPAAKRSKQKQIAGSLRSLDASLYDVLKKLESALRNSPGA